MLTTTTAPPLDSPITHESVGSGGRFDFDDGGTYRGGWQAGKAHGHGVCTGPRGQGVYAGTWVGGFEASGVYTWPSGNTYAGQWHGGKRHHVGVETKGHWVYRGEWTQGFKGRYGVKQSTVSGARYEGTWTTGMQDGYGVETYADDGTYQGQWLRGVRHGYGVRQSAAFTSAVKHRGGKGHHVSLPMVKDDPLQAERSRGGFVLRGVKSPGRDGSTSPVGSEPPRSRSSSLSRIADKFRLKKHTSSSNVHSAASTLQRQTPNHAGSMGRITSNGGTGGSHSPPCSPASPQDANRIYLEIDVADADTRETYWGEWKGDKRCGYGVSERSDGLSYVGEWFNDKKCGYGVTTFKDGTKEEGKYKDNDLVGNNNGSRSKLFSLRRTRLKDRVAATVAAAVRVAEVAKEKAGIALARRSNARQKAELADEAAKQAKEDLAAAQQAAKQYQNTTLTLPSTLESVDKKLEHSKSVKSSSSVHPDSRLTPGPPDPHQPPSYPARPGTLDLDRSVASHSESGSTFRKLPEASSRQDSSWQSGRAPSVKAANSTDSGESLSRDYNASSSSREQSVHARFTNKSTINPPRRGSSVEQLDHRTSPPNVQQSPYRQGVTGEREDPATRLTDGQNKTSNDVRGFDRNKSGRDIQRQSSRDGLERRLGSGVTERDYLDHSDRDQSTAGATTRSRFDSPVPDRKTNPSGAAASRGRRHDSPAHRDTHVYRDPRTDTHRAYDRDTRKDMHSPRSASQIPRKILEELDDYEECRSAAIAGRTLPQNVRGAMTSSNTNQISYDRYPGGLGARPSYTDSPSLSRDAAARLSLRESRGFDRRHGRDSYRDFREAPPAVINEFRQSDFSSTESNIMRRTNENTRTNENSRTNENIARNKLISESRKPSNQWAEMNSIGYNQIVTEPPVYMQKSTTVGFRSSNERSINMEEDRIRLESRLLANARPGTKAGPGGGLSLGVGGADRAISYTVQPYSRELIVGTLPHQNGRAPPFQNFQSARHALSNTSTDDLISNASDPAFSGTQEQLLLMERFEMDDQVGGSSRQNNTDSYPRLHGLQTAQKLISEGYPKSSANHHPVLDAMTGIAPTKTVGSPLGGCITVYRRSTLPSIVRYPALAVPLLQPPPQAAQIAPLAQTRSQASVQTFLVDSGVRRRVLAERVCPPPPPPPDPCLGEVDDTLESLPTLPERFRLEASTGLKASLPDVRRGATAVAEGAGWGVMPREDVSVMSQQRRDELREMRERGERQQVVIRLGDVTEWCRLNQLILFLIAINLCLAAMFFHLLLDRKPPSK